MKSDTLSKNFFDMHKGRNFNGCYYRTFLRRLRKFVKKETGNVNTVMYIVGFEEYLKKLEVKK